MIRTFIKLHGAWSGEPCYFEADDIISVGKNPAELSETLLTTHSRFSAVVAETPYEVMELILDASPSIVVENEVYEQRRDAELAAIAERAAQKEATPHE